MTAMRWTVQSVYWRLESNHDGLRGVVVEDDMVSEEKGSEHEGCDDEEESEKRVNNDVGKGSRSTTRPVAFHHSRPSRSSNLRLLTGVPDLWYPFHQTLTVGCAKCKEMRDQETNRDKQRVSCFPLTD